MGQPEFLRPPATLDDTTLGDAANRRQETWHSQWLLENS